MKRRWQNTPRDAWRRQRDSALSRGIQFEFNYDEWCAWWEAHLGPHWFEKRGPKVGQFVMARKGDVGPYVAHNVRCATVAENHVEHNTIRKPPTKQRRKQLAEDVVIAVFKAKGRYADIAQRHGIEMHRVHCIKCKKYYSSITNNL